jgi:hypothetical protein
VKNTRLLLQFWIKVPFVLDLLCHNYQPSSEDLQYCDKFEPMFLDG